MPRYVILRHELPPDSSRKGHWDFMLEVEGVLRTWALPQNLDSGEPVIGEALVDHRLDYLTYEGPIPAGRGIVARWDNGTYNATQESQAYLVVQLAGRRLQGRVTITRLDADGQRWRFEFSDG